MAKYYEAREDSFFEKTPLMRSDMADMLLMTARLLNLMERSKDIRSLKEVRDSLCGNETLCNKCHQAVVYDDTKELKRDDSDDEIQTYTYPIVLDLIDDAGDYDVLSYFDSSTTGINADIMVCVQKYKAEENGKVEQYCDKWIQIDFPDNDNEIIIISDGKIDTM